MISLMCLFLRPLTRRSMTVVRHLLLFFLLCIYASVCAQYPGDILILDGNTSARACPDRNAGTVSQLNFFGESNDISLTRSFLCLNDRFNIGPNGDAELLDSDPDPATQPGIGYVWYTCPPSVERPDLNAILGDPCLLTTPPPPNDIWVYVDDISGNALFQNGNQINGQTIPDFFNGGEPVEFWFAPITIDAVSGGMAQFEGNPNGPCVHVNTAAAFSIVYLTPIAGRDRRIVSDGMGGCLGSFEVSGGLPQFDASTFYNITIEHVDMPGTFGTLQGTDYGHGDQVTFSFTQEGSYLVTIEDGKSCGQQFEMEVFCTNPVSFNIGSVTADMGDVVCLGITLEGFIDMGTTSFDIAWNPNIFEYVSNSGFMIDADPLSQIVDARSDEGRLRVLWLARNLLMGQTEPDGSIFFEICLRAIGECGESTDISFDGNVIVTDFNNNSLIYLVQDGTAEINATSYSALADVCPDDGTQTGSINLSMCGGMAPYAVNFSGPNGGGTGSISDQNGSQRIDNLPAGDYSFSVEDANGMLTNFMVTIPAGMAHQLALAIEEPTCSYSADGKVGLSISPPGTYEIAWSTAEFNTDSIRNIENGQYAVSVTDQSGCAVISSFTVNTAPIAVQGTVTDATCLSSANGQINVSVQGGTPFSDGTYMFQWPGFPPVRGTTNTLSNIMRGDYTLTVSDSNGCFINETFTVNANREIVLDALTIVEPNCFGDETGSISIQVSTLNAGNDDGYIFDWERNMMNVNASFVTGADLSMSNVGLGAGRYDVTITDFDEGLDCILDTFVVINEPPPIMVELVSLIDETCNPGTDGEMVVRATGGRAMSPADYIYDWGNHPSITDFSPSQQGLSAGIFTLRVYDTGDLMCFTDTLFELVQEEGPQILSFDSTSVSCGGGMDGELEVFYVRPMGQTFNVNWTDQSGMLYSGDRITGLGSGTYTVTVTASAGCESIDTVYLGPATDIVLDSVQYGIPTCPNSQNGSVTVFATGPGGNLRYTWDHPNGSNNPRLPSVGVGTYSVTISADGSNCPPLVIDTLSVPSPDIFDVSFSGIQGATCPGICDGTAMASATGGTGTINYIWTSGETTANAMNLCAGSNFVTVSDNICFDVFEIVIPAADSISLAFEQDNPTCYGDQDGFIRLSPSGSNPPFDILWNDGPVVANRVDIGAGTYVSTVTDAQGCQRTDTFVLVEPDALVASIAPGDLLQITCAGRDDGRAMITATGGNPGGYTYNWQPNISSTATALGLSPGSYALTVADMSGCSDVLVFDVAEPPAIQFSFGTSTRIQCFGETAPFTVDTAYSGAGGPYTYTVNNGAQNQIGQTINLLGGQYVISVIDTTGCFIDTTIVIDQPPQFNVDIGEDLMVSLGDSARLEIIAVSGAYPIDSIIWNSTNGDLSCQFCPAPWITPVVDGQVNIIAVDSTGCRAEDELMVFVDARRKVFIPNAFSPNRDGVNELFEVYSGVGVIGIPLMEIYDRWGGKVFEARNLPARRTGSGGWDGLRDGEPLNPDVYVYVIQILFADNRVLTYNGEVQLLR